VEVTAPKGTRRDRIVRDSRFLKYYDMAYDFVQIVENERNYQYICKLYLGSHL
jgi:hypothetical protein